MKRKILIFAFLISACSFVAKSQFYVGGSFSILDTSAGTQVIIAPDFGYQLNEKWAIAGELGYYHLDGYNALSISPYARYTILEKGIISLFADGGVELFVSDSDTSWGIGITPGLAVKATNHLSFYAKYGYLGYSDTPLFDVKGISLQSNNLRVGFYYTF